MSNSLYIHIPFCRKKCIYCDFYSIEWEPILASKYIDVLKDQIKKLDISFSTIFIGGGTPSIIELSQWIKILKELNKIKSKNCEFSIELNPESTTNDLLHIFKDFGVNRLSLGIQSLSEDNLKKLGRLHSVSDGLKVLDLARSLGFSNLSIDLIYGIWGQSLANWKKEIQQAARLPIEHLSCYTLTYEQGTPLFSLMKDKSIKVSSDKLVAEMFMYNIEFLIKAGFKHYEVSNFAKEGFECKHNLNYWHNHSYLGLGAGAVSYWRGVRAKHICDVKDYIINHKSGKSMIYSSERLNSKQKAGETAAIKIRTKQGIDFDWFNGQTGYDLAVTKRVELRELIKKGLIRLIVEKGKNKGISLTNKGFLFCDEVSSSLL